MTTRGKTWILNVLISLSLYHLPPAIQSYITDILVCSRLIQGILRKAEPYAYREGKKKKLLCIEISIIIEPKKKRQKKTKSIRFLDQCVIRNSNPGLNFSCVWKS
ncbi:hypothetical protein V8C37DRAFT_141154 [Trichoderma ceciliae]